MPFSLAPTELDLSPLAVAYTCNETGLIKQLVEIADLTAADRADIGHAAAAFADALRTDAKRPSMIDAFLQEFSLSSDEGVLLMRLAESLIRTPDTETSNRLLRDKLLAGQWGPHIRARHLLVKLGTAGLAAAKAWIKATGGVEADHLLARLGDRVMLSAVRRAVGLLGRHYVVGTDIRRAATRAGRSLIPGATFSYDMLGEAAITATDAERYFKAYRAALTHLARITPAGTNLHDAPALSVKLSALHPRYEYAQRDACVPVLTERLLALCEIARSVNLGLTIDAEEADRLEVSLLVFDRLLASPKTSGWDGLGLVIQAYQRRALPVIDHVHRSAERHQRTITVRLVKGAYWDSEIKRAQELGLESYPVFTRKEHTDISYLACARKLLACGDRIYPQFATHNAHSAAAILHMAGARRTLEFQRLHGMGDSLHRLIADKHGGRVRTYAPVGQYRDLLPYLVRRLLENGANSSFVNQVLDPSVSAADLVRDPFSEAAAQGYTPHPRLPAPRDHFAGRRLAAPGLDLTQSSLIASFDDASLPANLVAHGLANGRASDGPQVEIFAPANAAHLVGTVRESRNSDLAAALTACQVSAWPETSAARRSDILRKAAALLQDNKTDLMALCVAEAGKTWLDADAEIREAIDFLLYYANQAERPDTLARTPLGPVACISPWNFPLAIFLGQVSAALAVGNTVLAKPAEQTPLIAHKAVSFLHAAGVPPDALHLILGDGQIGAALTADPAVKGVCFTGSTQTARRIAQTLSETGRGTTPLIAETGGLNAMIVDSTALLEQAVQDVVASAFQSAGQRCSACRVVCVQSDIAAAFNAMLAGAMAELRTGQPARTHTDLGPVIDAEARDHIETYIRTLRGKFRVIAEGSDSNSTAGTFIEPVAFQLDSIADLSEEIFGPVLHVVPFEAQKLDQLVEEINALGYGLTMGLHTRIDARVVRIAARAKVGNLYVNRNQIGAVVGVQPFGGQGLSGTGPKAGGPNYLARLCQPAPAPRSETAPSRVALPGPTGEDNTLIHTPRGRLLCLGGNQPDTLARQILRVQSTGNLVMDAEGQPLEDLILTAVIDGVVADGTVREPVSRLLARRPGPLLPLLSADDEAVRFSVEKTITVNTTAAGGNASLLGQI